ncbi:MAG: hypothetical protein IT228_08115 [Flavobacteriales bacterium]|nr:hypothetical protein [Flavobacteriales bacterium]MCC6577292.1 hypothetical protein [Flavobacteriales bacterium]NUQ13733.1 hypothetical protein [Flavobacteriales bacterium]
MKKQDVPQDDANMLEGKFRVVKYALNDEGEFEKVPSVGWEPENVALSQAWDVIHERVEAARQQVLRGERSPLAYHMEKNMMDADLLARHVDLPARRVKRHLEPAGFGELDQALLERYAEALLVTVDELKQVPR